MEIPCFLILYTRLFTKLNLFKILFYGTFITTKISRSTVYKLSCIINLHKNLINNHIVHY